MRENLSMLMDLYELTMANGIFYSEERDVICYFDMFFRRVPDDGGFAIMAKPPSSGTRRKHISK